MKRQSVGTRSSGEPEQQIRESKRLKVLHAEQFSTTNDNETGSGSDNTEEYMNSNGQDNPCQHSKNVEENKLEGLPESDSINNQMNGSFENDKAGPSTIPLHPYLINPEMEDNRKSLIQDSTSNFINGSDINHANSDLSDGDTFVSRDSDFDSPDLLKPVVGTFAIDKPYSPLMAESHQAACDDSDDQPPAPEDMLECNREQGIHDTPPDLSSSYNGGETSGLERDSSETLRPSCSSSAPKDLPIPKEIACKSGLLSDIENITMCQLEVTQLEGHADVVFCVDADEDLILSSSGDTTVKVWDVEEKKEMSNFAGHNAAVTSVILLSSEESKTLCSKLNCLPTPRIAASASYDCHIRLWSVSDGHEIASMYTYNSIMCMGFLKSHLYVVVGTEGGKLEVWDLHQAKLVHYVYAHDAAVSSVKVQDLYVYSTSKDGAVKVWLFEEDELQPLYTRRRKEAIADSADFGPTQWQAIGVHDDVLILGDNTRFIKTLNWRLGRLRLYRNQSENHGISEAILVKDHILLTSFFDPSTDTGGINVWRLPEMNYVGTLTGDLQEICSLAITRSKDRLRFVSGGHQLLVWDFDFSKPPIKNSHDPFFVCEIEQVGTEVTEEKMSPTFLKKPTLTAVEDPEKNKKAWCNIS